MKKFIFGAIITLMLSAISTSCGSGQQEQVNNDTIVSKQLADSISRTLGAMLGNQLQMQTQGSLNPEEIIQTFQIIAGNEYTPAQMQGFQAAMFAMNNIMNLQSMGVEVNRDLLLQEFRKYLQGNNVSEEQIRAIQINIEKVNSSLQDVLAKRDAMRQGITVLQLKEQQMQKLQQGAPKLREKKNSDESEAPAQETSETETQTAPQDKPVQQPDAN